jgi:hypothetical protein
MALPRSNDHSTPTTIALYTGALGHQLCTPLPLAELRGLRFVVGYQLLQNAAVPLGLPLVVRSPRLAVLLPPASVAAFHRFTPQLALFVAVFLARAALDHGVEFLLD